MCFIIKLQVLIHLIRVKISGTSRDKGRVTLGVSIGQNASHRVYTEKTKNKK